MTKKYTTVIVDDEKQARNALKELIDLDFPELEIIGEADGVEAAVALIQAKKPIIVLLDINLGDGSGFDVLEKLTTHDFFLIFTTAYDQYAIKAFKLNAIDYLLKPILEEDMKRAIEKITRQSLPDDISAQLSVFKEMMANTQPESKLERKIVLKDQDSIHFVKMQDIVYCKSEGSYTEFTIQPNQRIIVSNNLKDYEDLLAPFHFIRVHHSFIVNVNMIVRYVKGIGGSLILQGGYEVPVSQRKKDMVLAYLSIH